MQILAATDFSTRSNRALRQAGLLAQTSSASLAIVHIVDDDQPAPLVEMEVREAERILAEQIDVMVELKGLECRSIVLSGAPFAGILQAASSVSADLVVMGTHRGHILRDIFIGTTVERVIRTGPFPVLMVNNEAQRRYENVIAPVDMSESSARALSKAINIGLMVGVRTTLLHAFFPMAKGKMFIAGADKASIDQHVDEVRERAKDELLAFLVENSLNDRAWSMRLEEGAPVESITRAVKELRPDLLIMGTHGRSGILKALIGSVTEEALRSLDVDILAVPPVRQ